MSTAADNPENCVLGEECGVHYRVNARYEEGSFLNYTDYIGEYLIITGQHPYAALLALLGMDPYDTAILKVGDMTLHEKANTAYLSGEGDETWTAWTQGYSTAKAAKVGHDMVVQALKDNMLDLKA